GSVDRSQRQLRKRSKLKIFRIFVERRSSTGRNVSPSFFCGDEFGVVLVGCPCDEFFGTGDLLRTCGNRKIPCPKPVGILSKPRVRRQREADVVSDLAI